MKKITFEFFNDGVDILIGEETISLSPYSLLYKQKKSKKFKKYVKNNLQEIRFKNYCKSQLEYEHRKEILLNWLEK